MSFLTSNQHLEYLGDISEKFAVFTYQQHSVDISTNKTFYKFCNQYYVIVNKEDMVAYVKSHRDLIRFVTNNNIYAQRERASDDGVVTKDFDGLSDQQIMELEKLISIHQIIAT
jgi:hypothetical protein